MALFKRRELLIGAVSILQMVGLFVALNIFSGSMDKTASSLEQSLSASGLTPDQVRPFKFALWSIKNDVSTLVSMVGSAIIILNTGLISVLGKSSRKDKD